MPLFDKYERKTGEKAAFIPMYNQKSTKNSRPEVEKIGDGHYAVVDYGLGNVGFVVTRDGIVVIDANTTDEAAALREKAKEVN